MNRLVVHYAHTYEDVVNDMKRDGIQVPDKMLEEAKKMDLRIAEERRKKE